MPIYGQSTELNQRLSSLMSCLFCNSNDLYDGIDHPVKIPPSVTPSRISSRRPIFTEAILRKASRMEELRWEPKSLGGGATAKTSTVLEVVLVADQEDSARCNGLAKLVSHLFAMPEEHSDNLLLEVTTVRSHAIREDLTAARSSRSPPGSDCSGGKQRRRVFVVLGSALQGFCLYLHQEEVTKQRLQSLRDTTKIMVSPLPLVSIPSILAVVCVDPPPHLWKACGRSILDQTSLKGIPSLFLGYTDKDHEGVERIYDCLGEILNDCKRYPRALAVVAKDSAKILRRPNSTTTKENNRDFDACVWVARLITKYAESVHRIKTPPQGATLGIIPRKDEGPVRSMM